MDDPPKIVTLPDLLRCVVCDAVHPCVDEALAAGWVCFEGQWRCGRDRCSLDRGRPRTEVH
jgi:hypothetical protein